MGLDRAQADVQLVGDLRVGPPVRHRDQDLLLPAGERLDGLRSWPPDAAVGECREQSGGDARRDECVTVGGGVDRLDQELGSGVLEQESPGAGLEGAVHVLVEVEGGDHDDRERVLDAGSGELSGGLDAVQVRHPDVEQAHIGPELAGEGHRLASVGGLADHLDVGLGVEDHREPGADQLLVVGDEHPDGHAAVPSLGRTASTVQPRSRLGPASSAPPRSLARSVMPAIP